MSNRPLGVSLLCAFFGFIGFGSLISAFSLTPGEVPEVQSQSVKLFLVLFPMVMFLLGLLGLFAAVSLWTGHPLGRTGGLAWLGIWIVEELLVGVWSVTGPEIIQQVAGGIGGNLVRVVVGAALFYYLWTTGARYVESAGGTSSP